MMLTPVLTPHRALTLRSTADAPDLAPELGARLDEAFAHGSGHGLLWLGANGVGAPMPPVLSYWRDFGARYVTALCVLPNIDGERTKRSVPPPADAELRAIAAAVPPMTGAEYLTADVLGTLWAQTDAAFDAELAQSELLVQDFLKSRHPAWNLVGRVLFNLAENRRDEERPFAFLATYTAKLSATGNAQHLPLGGLAGLCRREEPRAPSVAPDAGPARRRALPMAQGHGGRRRNLPPAALGIAGGAAVPERRARAAKRRGQASAGQLEGRITAQPVEIVAIGIATADRQHAGLPREKQN